MQILIGFFHLRDSWTNTWALHKVGATLLVDHETWPGYDSDGGPDHPVALGIVTVTVHDQVWRAECVHPGDGQPIVVGGRPGREEVLEALRMAVAQPWLGREY